MYFLISAANTSRIAYHDCGSACCGSYWALWATCIFIWTVRLDQRAIGPDRKIDTSDGKPQHTINIRINANFEVEYDFSEETYEKIKNEK